MKVRIKTKVEIQTALVNNGFKPSEINLFNLNKSPWYYNYAYPEEKVVTGFDIDNYHGKIVNVKVYVNNDDSKHFHCAETKSEIFECMFEK